MEPWYNCINGRRFSTAACASAWKASITTYSWYLKVERYRVGYQSNQKLLITIIMQKISTIHKFILKKKQILGPHELNIRPHPSKNHWDILYIGLFYLLILQTVNFRVPSLGWRHTFFTMPIQKIFDHPLIFYLIDLLWIYSGFTYSVIEVAENSLDHMPGNLKFVHSKNINFHYRINSVKINDQFFKSKSNKPYFGPLFQFG